MNNYYSIPYKHQLITLMTLCSMVGCGKIPGTDRVTGAVELTLIYDGKPLPSGTRIQFLIPTNMKTSSAELGENGFASLARVDVGKNKIIISPPPSQGEPGNFATTQEYKNIPKKFRSSKETSIEVEVKEGNNQFEFDLVDQ